MKARLLGYTELRTDNGTNSEGHEQGCIDYTFYLQIEDETFSFYATESWGSCGSGYCSATWGDISFILYPKNGNISGLIEPKCDIFIPLTSNNEIQISITDSEYRDDATIESVKSDKGDLIVTSTGNGGCGYYPSGTVIINNKLFN